MKLSRLARTLTGKLMVADSSCDLLLKSLYPQISRAATDTTGISSIWAGRAMGEIRLCDNIKSAGRRGKLKLLGEEKDILFRRWGTTSRPPPAESQ